METVALVQTIVIQTLWFSMTLGVVVGGLAVVIPSELLRIFGSDHSVSQTGSAYCQVMIGLIGLSSLSNVLESTLQQLEGVKLAFYASLVRSGTQLSLIIAGILHHTGVVGIAWAAIIGQVAGLVIMAHFLRKMVFQRKHENVSLLLDWQFQKDAIRSAVPLIVDMLLFQGNNLLMWHILQSYGGAAFSSQRVSAEILAFPLAILGGFNVAVGRSVSRAYGNNDYKSIRDSTTSNLKAGFLTALALFGGMAIFGRQLAKPFSDDPQTTQQWIWVYVILNLAGVVYNVTVSALKALERNKIIAISSLSSNVIWFGAQLYAWHLNQLAAPWRPTCCTCRLKQQS